MTQGNAHVFPFRAFSREGLGHGRSLHVPCSPASWQQIVSIVPGLAGPPPRLRGSTPAESVLSAFLDPGFAFGEQALLADRSLWLHRLSAALGSNRGLRFVLLGFPFKAQVPLKTLRHEPDLGEAVMLFRLASFARAVRDTVQKEVLITICTEGILARTVGMPEAGGARYFQALQRMMTRLGLDDVLALVDLMELAKNHAGFDQLWRRHTQDFEEALSRGEPDTVAACKLVSPVIRHLVPCGDASLADVAAAYDMHRPVATISDAARALRSRMDEVARLGVPLYRGFLAAKDAARLLDPLSPEGLHMTVSPKRARLGIRPLPEPIDILPYHGVPVLGRQGFTIRYLCEAVLDTELQAVCWLEDADPAPFWYRGDTS